MADAPSRVFISFTDADEKIAFGLRAQLRGLLTANRVVMAKEGGRRAPPPLGALDLIVPMVSPAYLDSQGGETMLKIASDVAHEGGAGGALIVLAERTRDLGRLSSIPTVPRDGVPLKDARDLPGSLRSVAEDIQQALERVERRSEAPPVEPPPDEPPPPPAAAVPVLSGSVQAAVRGMEMPVRAGAIVRAILELHGEYGDRMGRLIQLEPRDGEEALPADEWLRRVRGLYREDVVPELHGRTVIRGLALLEPALTKQLLDHGFLASLEGELDPPLLQSLTPRGQELWEPGEVPTLADRPARVDRLRRQQFASGLAEMIDEERRRSAEESGDPESFLVQLHGPWGSGKSTLLGFLKRELEGLPSRWIVVEFNAWQQERLEAPWWSLMTAVHRTARRELARSGDVWRFLKLLWLEFFWRIRLGWMAYLLLPAVVGLLWYGAKHGWFETAGSDADWLTKAGDVAKAIGAILSVVVVVFGAVRGLSRSFAAGSARGADTFLRTSQDPMRTLRRRFERIVGTAGRPIAVFVDDLDRCQSSYVVEVLQGIQTLLIDAPVTYVVAADRRWLYDSYAKIYSDFESVGRQPGRPLGHLFLEKTFQLAAALPSMPSDVRDEFWRGLVVPENRADEESTQELLRQAEQRVQDAGLEEALDAVDASRDLSTEEEWATRAAVSSRLADTDVQQEIEHRLVPFGHLLESNPRAMKRLLNAYRIELRRLLAEGRQVGTAAVTPEQLALWTILSMRWPLLADEVAGCPELLSKDGSIESSNGLGDLWTSDDVQAVIQGDGVPARLTEAAVRALVGLKRRAEREPVSGSGVGDGRESSGAR